MVLISVLGNALKTILNAERAGKRQVLIRPSSKVVIKFLKIMQKRNYIGDFEVVDDRRGGKVVIELLGRINKCGVISPRFDVSVTEYEQAVDNLLPSKQFGYIVLTTNIGIVDHERATKKHVGGKLLGFFN
jgi:small subunit ribosomal protein S15Ae